MSGSGRARSTDADLLVAEMGALLHQAARWTERSWRVRVGDRSRADVVFDLVQRLADLAADAEHEPRRSVPRLDSGVLPDQLTVMVHDVVRSGSAVASRAALDAVRTARDALSG